MNEVTNFGPIAQTGVGEFDLITGAGILILVVWSLVWKGLALWTSARNKHKTWFIALLILNTVGILEIVYYFFFRKESSKGQKMVKEHFPDKTPEEEVKASL